MLRAARLNERLAAGFHRRMAALLAGARRMSDEVAVLYRRLADQAAREAVRGGFPGIARCGAILDRLLDAARRQAAERIGDLIRLGRRTAAVAVAQAIPAEWVPVLLGRLLRTAAREGKNTDSGLLEVHGGPGLDVPASLVDLWQDLRGAGRDPSLSPEQAKALIDALLFPPPTAEEVERALRAPGPGGLTWDERLARWELRTRQAMLNELVVGLARSENVDQLRQRLRPLADGLAWKAQRIARTEGRRAVERDYQARLAHLGDLLDGQQIVAVMDEWTRPEHSFRHGRIYRRGPDGVYRDQHGQVLPDLPDAPNCRCMAIPVFGVPDEWRRDPVARAEFETATGRWIPDPASYADWWRQAGRRERSAAVGARRYQTVRDLVRREPKWTDFLNVDGKLMSIAALQAEPPDQRIARQIAVEAILAARRQRFQAVASHGYAYPSG